MKKRKITLLTITVMLMCVLLAMPVSAAPKISKKKATMTVGQTLQLKVKGTKKKVKWSSNKKSVATVSAKGKVKAKKAGKATITAKVGKKKYSCEVTVKEQSKMILPNQDECGEANFYLYFASGTSENGKIPNIYVDKKFPNGHVDWFISDVDNSYPVRIYIDGKQVDIDYIGIQVQKSMFFSGNEMKKGLHTVEMVQFENNNPKGYVVTYRRAQYRVLYK